MFSRRKSKRNAKKDAPPDALSKESKSNTHSTEGGGDSKFRRRKKKATEEGKTQGSVEERTKEEASKEDKKDDPVYQKMVEGADAALATLAYYHGLMPRDEIEELLKKEGDFIVRKTDVNNAIHYAFSIYWNHKYHHLLLKTSSDGKWFINNAASFQKLPDLVDFYLNQKAELPNGLKILYPISRPNWYILHDNVRKVKKLGEGNFGYLFSFDIEMFNLKKMILEKFIWETSSFPPLPRSFQSPSKFSRESSQRRIAPTSSRKQPSCAVSNMIILFGCWVSPPRRNPS